MDTEAELFARLEKEQPAPTCSMRHPAVSYGPRPSPVRAKPCEKPAAWIAQVHDCRKKYPEGTRTLLCGDYVELLKTFEFPLHCAGCRFEFTNLSQLIWDLEHA